MDKELEFMEECANRINGFFERCPQEARLFFSMEHEYQHEMKQKLDELVELDPEAKPVAESATVSSLLAAILQTPSVTGYYLYPKFKPIPDPKSPTGTIFLMDGVQVGKRGETPPAFTSSSVTVN